MPARPARNFAIRDTAKKFGDVPFNETILTEEAFGDQIAELMTLIVGLSGEYKATAAALETLSGEYKATTADLETLSGEYVVTSGEFKDLSGDLYATTIGASGDIWNLWDEVHKLQ